ncbi:MAG: hypothetical protein ACI92E_000218 [Oceanicoccus sp.]|jgi:hypothetical protein
MQQFRRDTVSDEDYTILDYGWDGHLDGKRRNENPYAVNNWKHYEWENGWDMAKHSCGSAERPTND